MGGTEWSPVRGVEKGCKEAMEERLSECDNRFLNFHSVEMVELMVGRRPHSELLRYELELRKTQKLQLASIYRTFASF